RVTTSKLFIGLGQRRKSKNWRARSPSGAAPTPFESSSSPAAAREPRCAGETEPLKSQRRAGPAPSPQDRPLGRLGSRSPQSHQWNRELLEPGQAHAQPLQRHSESPLYPSFSRKRNFASTSEHPAPQTLGQIQGLANPI